MGINKDLMWLFAKASAWAVGFARADQQMSEKLVAKRVRETRVGEFGNQRMRKNTKLKFKTHGEYIRSMGFGYECFDINGIEIAQLLRQHGLALVARQHPDKKHIWQLWRKA